MPHTPESYARWHRLPSARWVGPQERTLLRQLEAVDGEIARLAERRADLAALIMRERAEAVLERRKDKPMLKRVVMVGLLLLAAAPVWAQTSFPLGQPLTVVWQGATNEVDAAVDHYEVRVDAAPFVNTGQTVPQTEYRYNLPQNLLTIGPHTVAVRACAGTICGDPLSVSLTIARPLPGLPRNPNVIPTPPSGAILNLQGAVDRANAYGLLILDRPLNPNEMNYLANRHGNVPPTRESVLRVLDEAFAPLVLREVQP